MRRGFLLGLFGALPLLLGVTSMGAQPGLAPGDPAPAPGHTQADGLQPRASLEANDPGSYAAAGPASRETFAFAIPVPGGVVPTDPLLLPGSPRGYRGGFHEGIDFPVRVGTPVYAAGAGTVARVDYAYQEWSEPAKNAALDNARRLGYTPDIVLDLIRGRQVWIDHGDGLTTRYAHLSSVAAIHVGDRVDGTSIIGAVGSSGFPEGGAHLHFEIRFGDSYLGAGLDLAGVRAAVARAFSGGAPR